MLNHIPKFVQLSILVILLVVVGVITLLQYFQPEVIIDTSSPVGLREVAYHDINRFRQLESYVWYPTDATETVTLFNDNAVFYGFPAIKEASMASGTYPLIVLSHGSGGNRANQGWLAIELVRRGAIVVAVNHPGSTSGDSTPASNIEAWHRPMDISFLLDEILADPQIASFIDKNRIGLVGHSLGGYTALAAGGAQLSLDRFMEYCEQFPDNPDCVFYRSGNVDLTHVDRNRFEAEYRDERVSAIVAIDPAYARSLQPESLQDMAATLLMAPPYTKESIGNLQVDYLAAELDLGVNFVEMEGAHHFTYLPECKPLGYYILMTVEADGELLCREEIGQSRSAFHTEAAETIIAYLRSERILSTE